MGLFSKKPKKSEEELKRESEEKIANTSKALHIQIVSLEKKKANILNKVVEARNKGLKEQEAQAKGLLKQTMVAIKREEGMLMTLELAVESRDLAQLNMNFLESISALSDDIISSGDKMNKSKTKKIEDKYLHAVHSANEQKNRIDEMLAVGQYANVVEEGIDKYSEYDQEIENMIETASAPNTIYSGNRQKY